MTTTHEPTIPPPRRLRPWNAVERRLAKVGISGRVLVLIAPVLWLLGQAAARLDSGLVSAGSFGLLDWLLLATVPIAGIALAVLTARMTVLGALRKKL